MKTGQIVLAVAAGLLVVGYLVLPGEEPRTVTRAEPGSAATTANVTETTVSRLADYHDAYGGDVSGTRAQQVLSVTEHHWGLEVQVSPADPELGVWACEQMQGLLEWSRRIEVWSENTVLASTALGGTCQQA